VEYFIRQKEADLHPQLDLGFQVYHQDSPALLPSSTTSGLFGSLFGISFDNIIYTAENIERNKHFFRVIAVDEYTYIFVTAQIT
jgi:hypothetical protein